MLLMLMMLLRYEVCAIFVMMLLVIDLSLLEEDEANGIFCYLLLRLILHLQNVSESQKYKKLRMRFINTQLFYSL